ncbi:MAG: thioesterase family protein [Burkholderiaceae bacterium]|nr:thioesterase family protein [Burkholderiaceae bacterium]
MPSPHPDHPMPAAAYAALDARVYRASELTRGPWDMGHQHAGPPVALVCRALEAAAQAHGLTHIARLTANILRPVPIGELIVEVMSDYVGRNAGHFSAHLLQPGGKEIGRFTALAQRETALELPAPLAGHPLPQAPRAPQDSDPTHFPFGHDHIGYADLVETRNAAGDFWHGPCAVWFRMRHALVEGESPSPYQRVAVAADSGNGISGVLDFRRWSFVNADLTINLLRRPVGEWICLEARTCLGPAGTGLAESALYDVQGLIGRATQSLAVRPR